MIAQERIKMEKIYSEMNRVGDGTEGSEQTTGSNVSFPYLHFMPLKNI